MDPPDRVVLPAGFEDVDVDELVQLIGAHDVPHTISILPNIYFFDFRRRRQRRPQRT